jgi:hypothetical protein
MPYAEAHPRHLHAQPLPPFFFRLYGLERTAESRSEILRIRLTPDELLKLKSLALEVGVGLSEYVRKKIAYRLIRHSTLFLNLTHFSNYLRLFYKTTRKNTK